MEKDWGKWSKAGIQHAVSCFYLTVGKLGMKSGTSNQAMPSSASQQHGWHLWSAPVISENSCINTSAGPWFHRCSQITTNNIQQRLSCAPRVTSRPFFQAKQQKDGCPFYKYHASTWSTFSWSGTLGSCDVLSLKEIQTHTSYPPREQASYGIRSNSHAPVEAT